MTITVSKRISLRQWTSKHSRTSIILIEANCNCSYISHLAINPPSCIRAVFHSVDCPSAIGLGRVESENSGLQWTININLLADYLLY